ncbi:hypothetical protein F5141DRAFT_1012976, partial [Pisolithus sp. B1]
FDRIIADFDPESRSVARWQRTCRQQNMYEECIASHVPEDVEAEFESRSMKYRPRDQRPETNFTATYTSLVRSQSRPPPLHCIVRAVSPCCHNLHCGECPSRSTY